MKANAKMYMVMLGGGNAIRIGQTHVDNDPSKWIDGCWHPSHAAELVPMTEEGFRQYVAKHGGTPVYPSLEAYPAARR